MHRIGRLFIATSLVVLPMLLLGGGHLYAAGAGQRPVVRVPRMDQKTNITGFEVVARQPTTSPISLDDLPLITTTSILTTVVVPIDVINQPTPTFTPLPPEPTVAPTPDPSSPALDAEFGDALEGTIIANRTEASVSFFVEGELYRLAPLRSLAIDLLRDTAVLNLYNCDADTPQTTDGCFWDPFLLEPDGFYEVFNRASGNRYDLTLREAGAPPENQVWVQNRTGTREIVFFADETLEIPPSTVKEFSAGENPIVTLYARNCLSLAGESVCEWRPLNLEPGFYYALEEVTYPGTLPDSQVNSIDARPLVSSSGETIATPARLVCQLQIPVLNVRSGPGLEYLIVGQTSGTETDDDGLVVVGRDPTNQWLAVDQRVAPGGWVISGAEFLLCDGDITDLAVAEVTDGRLASTSDPVVDAPAEGEAAEGAEGEEVEAEGTEPEPVAVPPGQALLIVRSAFEHDIRFTLSPDEYDLKQNDVINIPVNPGRVQFSVSTPWNGGLSGNAEIFLEEGQSFEMFLYFIPDPDDSGEWEMRYQ